MLLIVMTLVVALVAFVCRDLMQATHPLRRIYPVVGRMFELLLRLSDMLGLRADSGYPFAHDEIREIRRRALTGSAVTSFGAMRPVAAPGSTLVDVAVLPAEPDPIAAIQVGSTGRTSIRSVPVLNFGALGFGPVSAQAIQAIGVAARLVGCLQNTGEDGLTAIHRRSGARLIWQIGTGYWGCRNADGTFAQAGFEHVSASPCVELIELKLSQGGKPGMGGLLPATKNTRRVARILGVEAHTDVVSPPLHSAFHSVETMLEFVANLEARSGKPVGIKLCVGSTRAADRLVSGMVATGLAPSFVTIDGGEGGSGAAPQELLQHCGIPIDRAVRILDTRLREAGYRERLRLFAAGRLRTGFDLFRLLSAGADGCFFTRAPMIAMGCVQARRCHTNTCPSGLATQQLWRRRAISPRTQGEQLARYYTTVLIGYRQLLAAAGRRGAHELDPHALVSPEGHSQADPYTIGRHVSGLAGSTPKDHPR